MILGTEKAPKLCLELNYENAFTEADLGLL